MALDGGARGAGWMSIGMVALWALVAIAIMPLLPRVQDDQAHRLRRRSGGLR
jgi:hypothetical protein